MFFSEDRRTPFEHVRFSASSLGLLLLSNNVISREMSLTSILFFKKMARRQDRKVIKIEAAYGSDRQTLIVKRDYDLRVRDVQEDASKAFKMPPDQIILYWKVNNRFK